MKMKNMTWVGIAWFVVAAVSSVWATSMTEQMIFRDSFTSETKRAKKHLH